MYVGICKVDRVLKKHKKQERDQMNDPEFTGNETGPYEDPRDNFYYHNYLNPAQQYISWMHQWKKLH